jgi:acetyltransferase-like isoleucine patch superfamily enzyme
MRSKYLTEHDLQDFGFKSIGKNIQIDSTCVFVGEKNMEIGSNIRIDAYCILKGNICLKNNIHIGPHSVLSGSGGKIIIDSCSVMSNGAYLYTATDDFIGDHLASLPYIPEQYKKVRCGDIYMGKAVVLGSRTTVLPDVNIGDGATTSIGSIIRKNVPAGSVCIADGTNIKIIKTRNIEKLLMMQKDIEMSQNKNSNTQGVNNG